MASQLGTWGPRAEVAVSRRGNSKQYLVFAASKVEFAVPLESVSEIMPFAGVSELLGAPPHVVGVVQVRGRALPIIDLAVKLGRAAALRGPRTCIVLLSFEAQGAFALAGVVTDGIANLVDVRPEALEPVPDVGTDRLRHIVGLIATPSGMLPVLDLGQALAMEELGLLPTLSNVIPPRDPADSSDNEGEIP